MTFVKQNLKNSQFLKPAISTLAIQELKNYLDDRFSGLGGQVADDKPVVVTCFDTR
jgi:hypothetical protein